MLKSFKITKLVDFEIYSRRKSDKYSSPYHSREPLTSLFFKKYFPKYLKKLAVVSKKSSVIIKIKRVKIIQDFQDRSENSYFAESWRSCLRTKLKNVKVVLSDRQVPSQFLTKIRLFSNLSKLQIEPFWHFRSPRHQIMQKYFNKACKMIKDLRHVRHVEISDLNPGLLNSLHKLGSSSMFLSSLNQLRISCDRGGASRCDLLEGILRYKNLLRYITHLHLHRIYGPFHDKSFQSLANCCPNLLNLSFESSCLNYLGTLKTFQNLKFLKIDIGGILSVLRDFALPNSIKELRMNFQECFSKKLIVQIDSEFSEIEGFFEKNDILCKFYESFQSLTNLNRLELLFNSASDQEVYQYHSYFSHNILKRISSLKNLTLNYRKNDSSVFQDSYLSKLFQSCQASSQTLENIEIEANRVWYSNVNLAMSKNKFPKLSNVTVTGNFEKDQDSSNWGAGLFLKELLSLGDSFLTVKLETFVRRRVESLTSLLVHIKQLKIPEGMKVDLGILFLDPRNMEDLETSERSLKGGIDKLKGTSKVRRISVKIFVPTVHPKLNKFLEQRYVKKFDDCELIQYHYRSGF